MIDEQPTTCCSCLVALYRRLRQRDLRQLHPLESRNTIEIGSEKSEQLSQPYKKDTATFIRGTDMSAEALVAFSKFNRELRKINIGDRQLKASDVEVCVETPDSAKLMSRIESCKSMFNSAMADFQSIHDREFSPYPLDSSVSEIQGLESFSANSEPNFKIEVNSFEQDQMVLFMNHSSERGSMAAIKEQLDQAFEEQPKDSLNLKFKQIPVDPYEFENKPNLPGTDEGPDWPKLASAQPTIKANHDKFFQVFNLPYVKGRLKLKPITPDHFARRVRLPKQTGSSGNILDELKQEFAVEDRT